MKRCHVHEDLVQSDFYGAFQSLVGALGGALGAESVQGAIFYAAVEIAFLAIFSTTPLVS